MYHFFFAESVFWPVKSIIFIRCIRDAHHFEADTLPFPKCTITFFYSKYFGRYQHLNDEQLQNAFPLLNEFSEMALSIQADLNVYCNVFPRISFVDYQMS